MSTPELRRYLDDMLRGRRPRPFRPSDLEAAQIRIAIDLLAAGPGGDAPRPGFLDELHQRISAQMDDTMTTRPDRLWFNTTRRQVIVGTSAAAAVAAAGVAELLSPSSHTDQTAAERRLVPYEGSWQPIASSADVPDTVMRPFQHGSLIGFVRRVNGRPEAVSGICTHQGCRLWSDQQHDELRCPCHSTAFGPTGQVLTHHLPVAPGPLPRFEVRELNGAIELFAPIEPQAAGAPTRHGV